MPGPCPCGRSEAPKTAPATRALAVSLLAATVFSAGACGAPAASPASAPGASPPDATGHRPRVVATTTIIGDVVASIGGERIELAVLLPIGVDPHGFTPTSREVATVADADVLFLNGLGLEAAMRAITQNVSTGTQVITLSDGIDPLPAGASMHSHDEKADPGEEAVGAAAHERGEGGLDPHVWLDPTIVAQWAIAIEAALTEEDPAGESTYRKRSSDYRERMAALDRWIKERVAEMPADRRRLVSDHDELGYFARRYGFETVGTVLPGASTLAEPSAAGLARLQDDIRRLEVPAIFVGSTARAAVAEQVARDTGTRVVRLFTGSLGEPGGEAGSYEDLMRHNVDAMIEALSEP